MNFRISVIVPCYNEAKVIDETVSRLAAAFANASYDYEIIFINDGSKDDTLGKIEAHCKLNKKIKCISFSRNFGHQPALSAGILYACGDAAIIIDADLQDPPELIPRMVEIWQKENCNVVYGVRQKREQESFFKKITAKIYYRLINK